MNEKKEFSVPAIQIPDVLFERLQKLAVPLVDTPATVLERLITVYEVHMGAANQISSRQIPRRSPTQNRRLKSNRALFPA